MRLYGHSDTMWPLAEMTYGRFIFWNFEPPSEEAALHELNQNTNRENEVKLKSGNIDAPPGRYPDQPFETALLSRKSMLSCIRMLYCARRSNSLLAASSSRKSFHFFKEKCKLLFELLYKMT